MEDENDEDHDSMIGAFCVFVFFSSWPASDSKHTGHEQRCIGERLMLERFSFKHCLKNVSGHSQAFFWGLSQVF